LKRLEVIHLRLAGQRPGVLIQEIRDSMIRHEPNMVIRIYQHATVETDLAIHIQMNDRRGKGDGRRDVEKYYQLVT
jgi:hypothetical protein